MRSAMNINDILSYSQYSVLDCTEQDDDLPTKMAELRRVLTRYLPSFLLIRRLKHSSLPTSFTQL